MFPGKFRLLVKGEQWASWSQIPSKIPMYILEALFDPKHDQAAIPEMDLVAEQVPRCGPRDQDNIILEKISKKGAIFLQTKCCESEIGFCCTARQTKCSGNEFSISKEFFSSVSCTTIQSTAKMRDGTLLTTIMNASTSKLLAGQFCYLFCFPTAAEKTDFKFHS